MAAKKEEKENSRLADIEVAVSSFREQLQALKEETKVSNRLTQETHDTLIDLIMQFKKGQEATEALVDITQKLKQHYENPPVRQTGKLSIHTTEDNWAAFEVTVEEPVIGAVDNAAWNEAEKRGNIKLQLQLKRHMDEIRAMVKDK